MSRSTRPGPRRRRGSSVAACVLTGWHAAWMVLVGGCFYVKPIPDVDVNDPPVVVFPLDDPATVRVQDGRLVMSVGATDDEGGPIYFEWPDLDDVPHQLEPFTNGPIEGIRVQIDDPDLLHSDRVTALVVDDEPANLVPVHFVVEAP